MTRRSGRPDQTIIMALAYFEAPLLRHLPSKLPRMEITPDHRRWSKNQQQRYGRTRAYYLEMIVQQNGSCAFSGAAMRFDGASGTAKSGLGCHGLYAALDHSAPGSDARGHQIVCYALNDLKGHLPYDCFLAQVQTPAWQRLMADWRRQAAKDPDDCVALYSLLRPGANKRQSMSGSAK